MTPIELIKPPEELLSFKTKEEWLKKRREFVMSTEVPALLGVNKYGNTKFSLWNEKKGNVDSDFSETDRTRFGQELESAIVSEHCRREELEQIDYLPEGKPWGFFVSSKHPWLGASIDAMAKDKDGNKILIECKNVDRSIWYNDWTEDEAPLHIELQVQQQLACTGLPEAHLVALVGGNDLKLYRRTLDKELLSVLKKEANAFLRSLDSEEAPDPEYELDLATLRKLHKASTNKTKDGNEEDQQLIEHYAKINSSIRELNKEKSATLAKIVESMGENKQIVCERGRVSASHVKESIIKPGVRKAHTRYLVKLFT